MWDLLIDVLRWPGTKWIILVIGFVMPMASLLTWAERRQSAMMQDRLGPNRANLGSFRAWGILHFLADAIKMIGKEDFMPAKAHRWLFGLAPILALAPVFIAFAIIPFGPTIYPHALGQVITPYQLEQAARGGAAAAAFAQPITLQMYAADFGLLFYFAIMSLANYGGTVAGWASYNKWALLGGLRASSQMLSYEVAMGLSLMGVFVVTGSLEPNQIVLWQGPNPVHWLWLAQLPAFLLFFTAAIAETKRGPFDLPEGEPEIVGYFVEYSGIRWGMFFLAEFIEVVFLSAVVATVFFGGWQFPFLHADGFHWGEWTLPLQHWTVVLLQLLAFAGKVVFFCWLQLAIRWTLPRFRPDQLMQLGWKRLLPLALVNVMVTSFVMLWV